MGKTKHAQMTRRAGLAMVGAAGLAACAPPSGEPARNGSAGTGSSTPNAVRAKIGTSFAVSNLNPLENASWLIRYGAAQSLYRVTPDLRVAPWIATAIEPNGQDGYTIRLSPTARFHNGRPIDARAVQACLERQLAAGIQVPSLRDARWETVDPTTLRIKTSEPDPWLPNYLAAAYNFTIFDSDEVPDKPDPASLIGKGFLSGAFKPTNLTGDQLTLEVHAGVWDGAPKLAGVDVKFIRDPHSRFLALKTGEINMLHYAPADAVPLFKQTPGLSFRTTPSHERVLVLINHRRPPLNEVAIRQAIALTIDRKQIADTVLNGAYEATESMYPKSAPWYVPGTIKTDAAAARKLLDDAGWRPAADGVRAKDGKRLSFEWLHYPSQPDSKPMSEAIQAQLKAVGIEIRLKQVDDLTATLRTREYDLGVTYLATMMGAGSPMAALNNYFLTDAPQNTGGWGSAELDRLIKSVRAEFDQAKRNDLLKQIQEVFRRDVPVSFAVHKLWSVAVNADFSDYVPGVDPAHYVITKDTAPAGKR